MVGVDVSFKGTQHFIKWGPLISAEVFSRKMVLLSERSEVISEKLALHILNHPKWIDVHSRVVMKLCLKVLVLRRRVMRLLLVRHLFFIKVEVIESTHC
jgi:hypothetical protein